MKAHLKSRITYDIMDNQILDLTTPTTRQRNQTGFENFNENHENQSLLYQQRRRSSLSFSIETILADMQGRRTTAPDPVPTPETQNPSPRISPLLLNFPPPIQTSPLPMDFPPLPPPIVQPDQFQHVENRFLRQNNVYGYEQNFASAEQSVFPYQFQYIDNILQQNHHPNLENNFDLAQQPENDHQLRLPPNHPGWPNPVDLTSRSSLRPYQDQIHVMFFHNGNPELCMTTCGLGDPPSRPQRLSHNEVPLCELIELFTDEEDDE